MKKIKVFNSEIKKIDEKEGTLTAYVSTSAIDRMKEVLDPAGVDLSNYEKNPVVLWAHNYDLPPIGKALWVKRDGEGIVSKVKFANTEFAQEIFQLYKEGFLKAFSVGFIPKETEWAKDEDRGKPNKPNLIYKKWEMLEYSAVPVPANPEALSLAIQRGILKTESLKQAMEQKEEPVQEFNNEEEIEVKESNTGLEEIIAENINLENIIIALKKENSDLRFKIFQLLNTKQFPEMTVDNLASTTLRIMDGVIRKAQGKVN